MESYLFYILAAVGILAALALVTRASAFISAVWLVVCLLSTAGIFALLNSPLLASLQVLIAAGAVVVLIVFVVMLVDLGSKSLRVRIINFAKVLGALAGLYLVVVIVLAIVKTPYFEAPLCGGTYESPATVSGLLLGTYIIPFELTGVLLLVAIAAAVVVGKRDKKA